jgi:hypothetical protein
MTGASPLTRGTSGRTETIWPIFGFWIPIAIMVMVTPMMIDAQAMRSSVLGCICSQYSCQLTEDAEVAHILERPRQTKQEGNDQPNDTEDDCASSMISHGIHRNSEGQHMCAHDEDENHHLSYGKHLTTYRSADEMPGISIRVEGRVRQFKFAYQIAGVGGDYA